MGAICYKSIKDNTIRVYFLHFIVSCESIGLIGHGRSSSRSPSRSPSRVEYPSPTSCLSAASQNCFGSRSTSETRQLVALLSPTDIIAKRSERRKRKRPSLAAAPSLASHYFIWRGELSTLSGPSPQDHHNHAVSSIILRLKCRGSARCPFL